MGVCGSTKKPVPYLKKYFELLEQCQDEEATLKDMLRKPEQCRKDREKGEAKKKKLIPIFEMSFDQHDTKKTGYLDRDEADVFFEHYVKTFIESHEQQKTKVAKDQQKQDKVTKVAMRPMKDAMKDFEAAMKDTRNSFLKMKLDNYEANQADCNAKAFQFLDVSADGKVQKADVVLALTEGTEMYKNVHVALGLFNEMELMVKETQKEMELKMVGALGDALAGL